MTETEVQPGPETDAGNDDVASDVRAAIEQLKGEQPTEQAAAPDDGAREEQAAPERARNERGQFTKAEGAEAGEPAQQIPDADPASEQQVEPSNAPQPPTSWSAEAKAEWSNLSPALQQAVAKRESEMSSGAQRWSEEKRAYDDMLSPVRQAAQRAGVDEREGLQKLIAANEYLERDPHNAILWLAQAYGVDLSKPPSQQPQTRPDPVVNQLQQRLEQLEGTLTAREQAELSSQISAFAAQPGHEHFETVKAQMGHFMVTGQANDMQTAYDMAVWANPTTRQLMLSGQTASAEAARKAKEKETAQRARQGAISATGSPAVAPTGAKREYDTVEDAVRAAFAQHGSAA